MKIQRPYLQSSWRTDHARLLHSSSLFVYSVYGDNPRVHHCSILSGPAALSPIQRQKLAPSMQGESRQWPLSPPPAACGLAACASWDLPFSEDRAQAQEERVFPGQRVVSFVSILDPKLNALL